MKLPAFVTFIFLAALAAPGDVAAQCAPGVAPYSNPRVVPTPAIAGVPSTLRLTAHACATSGLFQATLEGNVLRVHHLSDYDFAHCTTERDVDFPLPALPTGGYLLSYVPEDPISFTCYFLFPPQPFGVVPAPALSVPAVNGWTLTALLALLLALAVASLRSRRRKHD